MESNKQDVVLMAVLAVTREDIVAGARELGIPEERVTDELIELVKTQVRQELRDWSATIHGVVKGTIEKESFKCPLGLVCSSTCTWREAGGCASAGKV